MANSGLRLRCATLIVAGVSLMSGCGGSKPTQPSQDGAQLTSVDQVKAMLQDVAKTGAGGSALMGLQESVEKLKPSLGDKGEKLSKGVAQLDGAPTPEARKAIAEKLLKDL